MKSWFLLFTSFLPVPVCTPHTSLKSAKIADLALKPPSVCNDSPPVATRITRFLHQDATFLLNQSFSIFYRKTYTRRIAFPIIFVTFAKESSPKRHTLSPGQARKDTENSLITTSCRNYKSSAKRAIHIFIYYIYLYIAPTTYIA